MPIRFNPRFKFESTGFHALSWKHFYEHLTHLRIDENKSELEDLFRAFHNGSLVRWLVRQNNEEVLNRVTKIEKKEGKYRQEYIKDLYEALMGTVKGKLLKYLDDEIRNEKANLSFTLKEGMNWIVKLSEDVDLEMIWIAPGSFNMGNDKYDDERPIHKVSISQGYWLGKYQLTQEQWKAVGGMKEERNYFDKGGHFPVEYINWNEARAFCKLMNEKFKDKIGAYCFDLPTEAQWEFAARERGLAKQDYSGSNDLDEVGWFRHNAEGETHEVAKKKPNELGLFDMSGNVWEWCRDRYCKYSEKEETDPQGPKKGSSRMVRGGSWGNPARFCRVSRRNNVVPLDRSDRIGFRIALVPIQKKLHSTGISRKFK